MYFEYPFYLQPYHQLDVAIYVINKLVFSINTSLYNWFLPFSKHNNFTSSMQCMRMQRILYISLSDGFKSWYNPVAYNSKYDEVQNTFFNFYVPCQIIHFSTVSILRPKHVKIVFVSYLMLCSGPTCTRYILPKLFLQTTSYREARLTYIQYACIYTNILILFYRNKN